MNRSRFLAAALAIVGLLGAAEVRSASNDRQSRLKAFQDKAQKERQALNLDKKALFARYPTPELTMVSSGSLPKGELPSVPVGGEVSITVTGRFVPGSMPSVECQGAEILSEKVTESRADLKVKVMPAAPAGQCDVRLISPVSLASARRPAFKVIGNYSWDLKVANGMKARMKTVAKPDTVIIEGTSEWFDKSGKSLGSRLVRLERTEEGYHVEVQRTTEEINASKQAAADSGAAFKRQDNQKAAADIQAKMQAECMKLTPDKMGACIQKYTAEMTALSQRVQNQGQVSEKKALAVAVGCQSLELAVNETQVTGRGTNCGAPGESDVTGTVKGSK